MSVTTERIIQDIKNLSGPELVEIAQWLLKRIESHRSSCESLADSEREDVWLRKQRVCIPVTVSSQLRSTCDEILRDSFVCPSGVELIWREILQEEVGD